MLRLDLGLYSHDHPKEFWGVESEPMLTPREKIPLCQRLRGRSVPRRCIRQNNEPNTLPTELLRPPDALPAGEGGGVCVNVERARGGEQGRLCGPWVPVLITAPQPGTCLSTQLPLYHRHRAPACRYGGL